MSTLVQTAHGTGSTGTTASATFASASTNGNLLVALVSAGKNPGAVTFTTPTSWATAGTRQDDALFVENSAQTFTYVANPGGITTVSVTLSSAPLEWTLTLLEFSGIATSSALDGITAAVVGRTGRTSGSITPTTNGDLILALAVIDAANAGPPTITEASGFTTDLNYTDTQQVWFTIHVAHQVQTTAAAIAYAPTWTGNDDAILYILAFKPASGATANTLGVSQQATFSTRMTLVDQTRSTFFTRAVLAEQSRSRFLTRMALHLPTRTRWLTRAALVLQDRARYLTRAVQKTQARASFATRIAVLATTTRAKFLTRARQLVGSRARFLTRASLIVPQRARFITRLALTTSGRAKFQTRIGTLASSTRARFLISSLRQLAVQTRARFATRTALRSSTRARFFTRTGLSTAGRARFQTRISALTAPARARFLVSTLKQLLTAARVRFQARAGLTTSSRSRFAIRINRLAPSANARFATRFTLATRVRSRFLSRVGLAAKTRLRFVTRVALAAPGRAKFVTSGIVNILPFRPALFAASQALRVTFATLRLLTSTFLHQPGLSASFHAATTSLSARFSSSQLVSVSFRSPPVANPNSSLQVKATVLDVSGSPVTNCAAVTCTVTFPDGSTSAFSLTAGISNSGAGVYTLSYKTKGVGINLEDWTFTAADGVTTAEYHNTTPVEF